MSTFFTFIKQYKLPPQFARAKLFARPLTWQGLVLSILFALTVIAGYVFLITFNDRLLVKVPAHGGTLTEGVIGAPQFINPLLATTETDQTLTTLVYSGLMRITADGTIQPDLAESYSVSPDGLRYTFTLAPNLKWSDGKPLTSSDISFTYGLLAKTDQLSMWQTIAIDTPTPQTVVITLPAPDSTFLKETTLRILPAHLWSDLPIEALSDNPYNLRGVGSGPWRIAHVAQTNGVTSEITLKRNKHYNHTHPYIDTYRFAFFANQTALQNALLDTSIDMTFDATIPTVRTLPNNYRLKRVASPDVYSIFAQQGALSEQIVARAQESIDKDTILAIVESGYVEAPVASNPPLDSSFSLAVENDPSLLALARALKETLATAGIDLTIKAFDYGIFEDGIQRQQYPIILAARAPLGYKTVVPLYTKSYLLVHDSDITITTPEILTSPTDRYRDTSTWYVRYNKVWRIFANNNR